MTAKVLAIVVRLCGLQGGILYPAERARNVVGEMKRAMVVVLGCTAPNLLLEAFARHRYFLVALL